MAPFESFLTDKLKSQLYKILFVIYCTNMMLIHFKKISDNFMSWNNDKDSTEKISLFRKIILLKMKKIISERVGILIWLKIALPNLTSHAN